MRALCHQSAGEGLLLFVRLTPNAGRDEVLGVEQGADGPLLKAKVRAIPDKGRANAALIELVARWLRLAKSGIELRTGSTSRQKTLLLSGDGGELAARVEAALARLAEEGEGRA
jgi:uncharacterized protein (TIGR00251 family)